MPGQAFDLLHPSRKYKCPILALVPANRRYKTTAAGPSHRAPVPHAEDPDGILGSQPQAGHSAHTRLRIKLIDESSHKYFNS